MLCKEQMEFVEFVESIRRVTGIPIEPHPARLRMLEQLHVVVVLVISVELVLLHPLAMPPHHGVPLSLDLLDLFLLAHCKALLLRLLYFFCRLPQYFEPDHHPSS